MQAVQTQEFVRATIPSRYTITKKNKLRSIGLACLQSCHIINVLTKKTIPTAKINYHTLSG